MGLRLPDIAFFRASLDTCEPNKGPVRAMDHRLSVSGVAGRNKEQTTMKYAYTAILESEKNDAFTVTIPNIPGYVSYGEQLA